MSGTNNTGMELFLTGLRNERSDAVDEHLVATTLRFLERSEAEMKAGL